MSDIEINLRGVNGLFIPLAAIFLIKAVRDVACRYLDLRAGKIDLTDTTPECENTAPVETKPAVPILSNIVTDYKQKK